MIKDLKEKLTKHHYFSFLSFIIGYIFAISNSDKNLMDIFINTSAVWFALFNVLFFIITYKIFKSLLKNYKYFEAKIDFTKNKNFLIYIKTILLGYFLGCFTLLGNVFIKVLFINILS